MFGIQVMIMVYLSIVPKKRVWPVPPAGVAHRYYGTAVGKGRQSVKTEIERLKFDQLTCRQAVVECAKV